MDINNSLESINSLLKGILGVGTWAFVGAVFYFVKVANDLLNDVAIIKGDYIKKEMFDLYVANIHAQLENTKERIDRMERIWVQK